MRGVSGPRRGAPRSPGRTPSPRSSGGSIRARGEAVRRRSRWPGGRRRSIPRPARYRRDRQPARRARRSPGGAGAARPWGCASYIKNYAGHPPGAVAAHVELVIRHRLEFRPEPVAISVETGRGAPRHQAISVDPELRKVDEYLTLREEPVQQFREERPQEKVGRFLAQIERRFSGPGL